MTQILNILQLVFAVLVVVFILIQQRGAGLGGVFGGDSGVYRTKRGAEKIIFVGTIILSFLFLATTLLNVFLSQ